jgi:uncharacterized protein DUF3885
VTARRAAIRLGPDWHHELWASPFRLRFELSHGGPYVSMFTSAYDRARRLARAALPAERVVAVIAAIPNPSRELGAKQRGWTARSAYDVLKKMGVPTTPPEAAWTDHVHPPQARDDTARRWRHRAVSVTWDQADILLWNQVARDIGVQPQAPVLTRLVDLARGISVHAYDDRGMDIIALNRDTVADLYTRFNDWLLDHDRPRMTEVFAAGRSA